MMSAESVKFATRRLTSSFGASSIIHCVINFAKFAVPVVAVQVVSVIPTPFFASRKPAVRLFPICTSAVATNANSNVSIVPFFTPNDATVGSTNPNEFAVSNTPEIAMGTYTPDVTTSTVCVV
jgi:hypothetical protein